MGRRWLGVGGNNCFYLHVSSTLAHRFTVILWIILRIVKAKVESNCQHLLNHRKSKKIPEKHLLLLYWLCQSLWLRGSQQTVENSEIDRNTRPPYLPPQKLVCRSRAIVRNRHGTMGWFQIGKGVSQGCILSPCLFNLYAEYIMRNATLDEAQAGIKIAG